MQRSTIGVDPEWGHLEWLETDGLGGYAHGTALGIPSRKYHGYLTAPSKDGASRHLLVHGVEAILSVSNQKIYLNSYRFKDGTVSPEKIAPIKRFSLRPFPQWTFEVTEGVSITFELFLPKGKSCTMLSWAIEGDASDAKLFLRPFISGRDYHDLHHANESIQLTPIEHGTIFEWQTYSGVPRLLALSNGSYRHDPIWFYGVHYAIEADRGYDASEDWPSPGVFEYDLSKGSAVLSFLADSSFSEEESSDIDPETFYQRVRHDEKIRRDKFQTILDFAADSYFVQRDNRPSIIAGYPWFGEWGRDTFIALRGLGLALKRFQDVENILVAWSSTIKDGLIPNRFPDDARTGDYNSVDASLWYIVTAWEYLNQSGEIHSSNSKALGPIKDAVSKILHSFTKGTQWNIRSDSDGLLAAGAKGVQLTWMDAKIGDWVITPRIGKPVEIQALWLNALNIGSLLLEDSHFAELFMLGHNSFNSRFPVQGKYLFDVIDVNHQKGVDDATFRINQIFAVGGLPFQIIDTHLASSIVSEVEARLYTPNGMRSLEPSDPSYIGRYMGGHVERDKSYHQGTAWFWPLGPFVEGWVRVRGLTKDAKEEARARFVDPIIRKLNETGSGHIFEISDGDEPFTPRGTPCQAWSLGELLRLDRQVLTDIPLL